MSVADHFRYATSFSPMIWKRNEWKGQLRFSVLVKTRLRHATLATHDLQHMYVLTENGTEQTKL
jgi:S-formylglutathione hydrolase FrmB